MKAILLCGGRGTRLAPITSYLNKHLFPVLLKNRAIPIVELGLNQLQKLGCRDIAVVLGDHRAEDIMAYFHNIIEPISSLKFQYFYQGEPLGIAHAVSIAHNFVKGEEGFLVLLGDNCFLGEVPISETFMQKIVWGNPRCSVIFARTPDPQRFGSPVFDGENLIEVIEKPEKPQTNLALTGLYYFNTEFFFDTYTQLKPSGRGEYELTDIVNWALKVSPKQVYWNTYNGLWIDAGTFSAIHDLEKRLNEMEK